MAKLSELVSIYRKLVDTEAELAVVGDYDGVTKIHEVRMAYLRSIRAARRAEAQVWEAKEG